MDLGKIALDGTTSAGSNATNVSNPAWGNGATYLLTPSSNGVSVVSSDSAHNFSGIGLQ